MAWVRGGNRARGKGPGGGGGVGGGAVRGRIAGYGRPGFFVREGEGRGTDGDIGIMPATEGVAGPRGHANAAPECNGVSHWYVWNVARVVRAALRGGAAGPCSQCSLRPVSATGKGRDQEAISRGERQAASSQGPGRLWAG